MDPNIAPLPNDSPSPTMAAALRARVVDSADRVFLRFDEASWTFTEAHREACRYANLFLGHRDATRPFHVGVLMDNVPEFVFTQAGCALAGATLVGLNPTRTGEFLARELNGRWLEIRPCHQLR